MRLATYAGLVLRRLWAKKGILLGSFLGATLVTALLVIVPLYESSIAAIDLVFTFRQAPSAQVDARAVATQVPYDPDFAQANRDLVEGARQRISMWYPETIERTESRELAFIPVDIPSDKVAQARAWQQAAEDWIAQAANLAGLEVDARDLLLKRMAGDALPADLQTPEIIAEIGSLPAPPYPTPSIEATQSRLFTAPDIEERLDFIDGGFPERASSDMQVVLGAGLARVLQLEVGDRTILKPFVSGPTAFEVVEVTGIATAADPASSIWQTANPDRLIFVTPDTFDVWSVVRPIDQESDPWLRTRRGLGPINASQSWALEIDRDSVRIEEVDELDSAIQSFTAELGRNGLVAITAVPALIEEFDIRSVVFGAPILAMLALVVAGALYFLIYTAALTVEREGAELALLRSRGASAWQTVGIHLAQSLVIAIAAALVAPFVARAMVTLTGLVPPMSDLTGGEPLRVATNRSILPFALTGAVITFVSMGLTILPFARRGVLELRALAARPTRRSVWQRYYIDVFGIVLAGILLFELRQRGLVEASADPGLDPFAIASPALFLFAGALVLLRVLPFILRGLGWLLTKARGMATALPGWHLGRNPIPYGRLALLIWLTTGFGAFALTYAQTLDTSYTDRASFESGGDARIIGPEVGLLAAPDDVTATPVYRTRGAPRGSLRTTTSEVLAIRPDEFAEVVSWRDDFGPDPETLFGLLRPDGAEPDLGFALPDDATMLTFDAVTVPESWATQDADTRQAVPPDLQMVVRAVDEQGRLWTFVSEPIADDGWRAYEVDLSTGGALFDGGGADVVPPLQVQSVWLERRTSTAFPQPTSSEEILIDDLAVVTADGTAMPIWEDLEAELEARSGLVIADVPGSTAVSKYYSQIPEGAEPPSPAERNASPLNRDGTVQAWRTPQTTRAGGSSVPHLTKPPQTLRVLIDSQAAALGAVSVGDVTAVGIDANPILSEIVGRVSVIPTADDPTAEGVIVTDLDVLMHHLNLTPTFALTGNQSAVASPQELWIRADQPDVAVARLLSATEEEVEVVTVDGVEAAFSSRPVQIGLVSILFVGAATGIILALAGVTSYVLIAVRRRTKEMGVLRALGFQRTGVARTFAVEQLVVLGLGAIIGVLGGVALMRLLIPFIQLGEEAEVLNPPVILVLDWRVLGIYLAVLAALLVTSVLWATRRVSARDLAEVLREVER